MKKEEKVVHGGGLTYIYIYIYYVYMYFFFKTMRDHTSTDQPGASRSSW